MPLQQHKEAVMNAQALKLNQAVTEAEGVFGELPPAVVRDLEAVTLTNTYPAGALLFAEADVPRGVFIVVRGRVKLSVCASDGRTLILRIAGPGEALGAASAVSGREYEATAETQETCEISFIRQNDLMRLMRIHGELAFWVTQQLTKDYNYTCREIRTLMLSDSAGEKLARLLVGFLDENTETKRSGRMKLTLTHEEIGQMIGTSRETVTRLFAGFKKKHVIEQNGATLVVANRMALESLISA
jgi:CRP/FNR family transcriptional regulator, cyclic AMP receptor protein